MKKFLKGKQIEVRKAMPVDFLDIDIEDVSTTTIVLPREEYEVLLKEEFILLMVARLLKSNESDYIKVDILRRIIGLDELDENDSAADAGKEDS